MTSLIEEFQAIVERNNLKSKCHKLEPSGFLGFEFQTNLHLVFCIRFERINFESIWAQSKLDGDWDLLPLTVGGEKRQPTPEGSPERSTFSIRPRAPCSSFPSLCREREGRLVCQPGVLWHSSHEKRIFWQGLWHQDGWEYQPERVHPWWDAQKPRHEEDEWNESCWPIKEGTLAWTYTGSGLRQSQHIVKSSKDAGEESTSSCQSEQSLCEPHWSRGLASTSEDSQCKLHWPRILTNGCQWSLQFCAKPCQLRQHQADHPVDPWWSPRWRAWKLDWHHEQTQSLQL